jgi:hypothetical protein
MRSVEYDQNIPEGDNDAMKIVNDGFSIPIVQDQSAWRHERVAGASWIWGY